ncbi:MAG TPA: T9SS type A sorting domain-containing protein [Saprospiraceae bacterium]|nr:T9SS type A sorting domain-containing protein [Saprospiraceae bacterium]
MNKTKLAIVSIAWLLGIAHNSFSQQYCGTSTQDQHHWIVSMESGQHSTHDFKATSYIPLQVHNVGNDNGSSYYAMWYLLESLCTLNEDFKSSGIQFYLENPIHYIAKTAWNNHPEFDAGEEMMIANNVQDQVNCYIVQNPAGNCGYYTYGGDGVALGKGCMGRLNHTWAHELGHFFSLPHTFFGWEGIDYKITKPTRDYQNQVWTPIENLDRTNCSQAADRFCDTYPDYISDRWSCDVNQRGALIRDLNDSTTLVDGTLFMSYANDRCMNRFSDEQVQQMYRNYNNNRQILKRSNVIPLVLGNDDLNIAFPADSSTIFYKHNTFSWAKLNNAKYLVQVSRFPSFSSNLTNVTTDSAFIMIDSLTPGKTYYMRVKAFNDFDFCGKVSRTIVFHIEPLVTKVNEAEQKKIILSPNPISGDRKLVIQTNEEKLNVQELQLINSFGQVTKIAAERMEFFGNQIQIDLFDLPKGVYFLTLKTKTNYYINKLLIQNQ